MKRALGYLLRCQRGAAAIEFAIVGNVLIMLLVGGVDFGRTLYVKNELSFLADKATRTVMISPGISDTTLTAELREAFSAGTSESLTVTVTGCKPVTAVLPLNTLVLELKLNPEGMIVPVYVNESPSASVAVTV